MTPQEIESLSYRVEQNHIDDVRLYKDVGTYLSLDNSQAIKALQEINSALDLLTPECIGCCDLTSRFDRGWKFEIRSCEPWVNGISTSPTRAIIACLIRQKAKLNVPEDKL